MKFKLILCHALVLSGSLFGCSTTADTASDPVWVKELRAENRSDVSRTSFTFVGKVVAIRRISKVLKSITVEWTPLKTELGVIGKPGDIVVIHFDEPVSKLGSLQLTTGSIVRLVACYAVIGKGSNHSNGWKSSCSSLGIKNNGAFYYSNGEKSD